MGLSSPPPNGTFSLLPETDSCRGGLTGQPSEGEDRGQAICQTLEVLNVLLLDRSSYILNSFLPTFCSTLLGGPFGA